ncbi:MAG: hypothetical protein ABS54_10215 [Hyphomicrobium sp. SCN 65-11]|nr:MAG: hypothetical protein ABS54_10215 [Hyphomicrobium sp. SCN 65-11]
MNTMYVVDSRHRPSKGGTALARLEFPGVARLRANVVGIWRAVARLLGALDKRMTANLDRRARLMLYGDRGPPDAKRPKK